MVQTLTTGSDTTGPVGALGDAAFAETVAAIARQEPADTRRFPSFAKSWPT